MLFSVFYVRFFLLAFLYGFPLGMFFGFLLCGCRLRVYVYVLVCGFVVFAVVRVLHYCVLLGLFSGLFNLMFFCLGVVLGFLYVRYILGSAGRIYSGQS